MRLSFNADFEASFPEYLWTAMRSRLGRVLFLSVLRVRAFMSSFSVRSFRRFEFW